MCGRRQAWLASVFLVAAAGGSSTAQIPKDKSKDPTKPVSKDVAKTDGKQTPAEITRTKLLKTKVSGSFQEMRLGDILKELADQVDMQGEQPVMWAYGPGFPFDRKVNFECKEKPLDTVLDQLLNKAGEGLGYVVVSREGDKYDGWVRLTTTGERGVERPGAGAATAEDEASAADKLTLAKKLINIGNPKAAKPVLEILVKNYANTKAGAEAKEILEKLEK